MPCFPDKKDSLCPIIYSLCTISHVQANYFLFLRCSERVWRGQWRNQPDCGLLPGRLYSNCKKPTSPATASKTFVLNKCYAGKMYDCSIYDKSVTYMVFADVQCAAKYPSTYGLPASMCLTSVYGYSADDTFFTCT